jgi:hypothetical protein
MGAPLTLKQTISIATHSSVPPWHASGLRKNYGTVGHSLSLLSVRDQLQAQKTIFILQIRDSSILSSSADFHALQANWASLNPAWTPTKESLASLFQVLNGNGLSVKKLSRDWRIIAITGTAASFASVPGVMVTDAGGGTAGGNAVGGVTPLSGGWGEIGAGAAGFAGILMAAGVGAVAVTPVGWAFAVGAIGAAIIFGTVLGDGIYDVVNDQPGVQTEPMPGYETPDASVLVYGASSVPDAATISTTLSLLPTVDPSTIQPPAPPVCPTLICPTVPVCPPGPPPPPPVCPGGE